MKTASRDRPTPAASAVMWSAWALLPAGRGSRSRQEQFVSGIDHDWAFRTQPDRSAEADTGPARDPRDVRPSVKQRGQVPGRIRDLDGEHGVALHGAYLYRVDAALDGGPARPAD